MRVCFEKRPSGEIQLLAYPTQETMDRIPGPLAESMPLRLKCSSGETIQKNGEELSFGIGVGTYLVLVLFPEILVEAGRGGGGTNEFIWYMYTFYSFLSVLPGVPHSPF